MHDLPHTADQLTEPARHLAEDHAYPARDLGEQTARQLHAAIHDHATVHVDLPEPGGRPGWVESIDHKELPMSDQPTRSDRGQMLDDEPPPAPDEIPPFDDEPPPTLPGGHVREAAAGPIEMGPLSFAQQQRIDALNAAREALRQSSLFGSAAAVDPEQVRITAEYILNGLPAHSTPNLILEPVDPRRRVVRWQAALIEAGVIGAGIVAAFTVIVCVLLALGWLL